ncbi:MAG: hypothetical protein ACTSXO_07400 [Candidatus Heimdallarchaeota archaeon]|nr:hypothetical protein [Candidatus Heimdallarchaeota archaeon]
MNLSTESQLRGACVSPDRQQEWRQSLLVSLNEFERKIILPKANSRRLF